MTLELVKQKIAINGSAFIQKMVLCYPSKVPVNKYGMGVVVTEVTESTVSGRYPGIWKSPEAAKAWGAPARLGESIPFRVKHNGKKFSFGTGANAVHFYFKDVRL